MTQNYPQPREGITGVEDTNSDLLSLDEAALPRRQVMAGMARCLRQACCVGSPAPIVSRMWERMSHPRPGDLVLEVSRLGSLDAPEAFGILLAHRMEWYQTDSQWQEEMKDEPEEFRSNDNRATDHAWYVQYGPHAEDVCRWVDCMFMMIPVGITPFRQPFGVRTENGLVVLTAQAPSVHSGFTLNPSVKREVPDA